MLEVDFGLYHTPCEFMKRAQHLVHPFDAADRVTDAAFRAILSTITRSPVKTREMRSAVLAKWWRWALELQPLEEALHAKMPERVASVYKGKRLLLLHRILESAGFGFPNLVRDIIAGCRITGDMG